MSLRHVVARSILVNFVTSLGRMLSERGVSVQIPALPVRHAETLAFWPVASQILMQPRTLSPQL